MKKKFCFGCAILLVLLFALCSCTPKEVVLGSVGGLELKTSEAERVENKRWNNIFRLKDGLSGVKADLEERYGGDATFAVKEIGTDVLAFSRKRTNKFDGRTAETWMFPIGASEYLYLDVCGRLVSSADFLEKDVGIWFWLPVKHMVSPKVLYVNEFYMQQLLVAYENVSYPLACEFSELKTYYENLGFYLVETDETDFSITLKLKKSDDDLIGVSEENFKVSVKVSYQSADEDSDVKGSFKVTVINV